MIDLAIVGAGAAGISAAREARRRGLSCTILEALDRVGGRARSFAWGGHKLDLGAGWLHSANRNPLVPLAEDLGLAINRAETPWRGQYQALGFSREDQKEAYRAFASFEETVSEPQPEDVAARALPTEGRWNAFIEALSGYLNGTSLENMSAKDYAAYSGASNANNWRLPSGYGALIHKLADGLEVEHGFAVTKIDWTPGHVRLSSELGSLDAKRAIITLSSAVLARGAIRFLPALDAHLHAAGQLPLGHVEKAFFGLEDAEEFPNDAHLIGNPHRSDTGSYMLRPLGIPVIEAFFGGDWVAGAGAGALEALARDELASLLGGKFERRMRPIASSSWKDDPCFAGAYSYARPRQHEARALLATSLESSLTFAGEACSSSDFSTVHGAWQSGIAAVERLFGHEEK